MSNFTGTSSADAQDGTAGKDTFDYSQGGQDHLNGMADADLFYLGATFDTDDFIRGGGGFDTLALAGDYSAGVVFGDLTIRNVEKMVLGAGFDYRFTFADANVNPGTFLRVGPSPLPSAGSLYADGSAEKDGYFKFFDFTGDDTLIGGAQGDQFTITMGNETVFGGGGNDLITVTPVDGAPGSFTAADRIDGGAGYDILTVQGNAAGTNIVLAGATLNNVEELRLTSFAFQLTTHQDTVATGKTLVVNAGLADSLVFDGTAESDGTFDITGSAGDDTITGGGRADTIHLGHGGADTVSGGEGGDTIDVGGALSADDLISGGHGHDVVSFNGDYSGGLTLASRTIRNVEILRFGASDHFDTHLILHNGNVGAVQILTVDAASLAAGHFVDIDGSDERDGSFDMTGSAGNDVLTGGANGDTLKGSGGGDTLSGLGGGDSLFGNTGSDTVNGGSGDDTLAGGDGDDTLDGGGDFDWLEGDHGADTMHGGSDADVFAFFEAADSTGPGYDSILDFNTHEDNFAGLDVSGIDAAVAQGALNIASFDANLSAAIGAAELASGHAVLFTASTGDRAGHTFLVVDLNGNAGYQGGADLVVDLTGGANLGDLGLGNFGA